MLEEAASIRAAMVLFEGRRPQRRMRARSPWKRVRVPDAIIAYAMNGDALVPRTLPGAGVIPGWEATSA